ncbi:MAG: sulfatase-like hydrolase/transferase [Acidobacteria bacterium]|nr:sulfatase-like hydrolase/transferase [Acidobacteriota bacterium]
MKLGTHAIVMLLGIFLGAYPSAAKDGSNDTGASRRPNILLVIADDIGIDVLTDAYPGLINDLVKKYGPSGHKHAEYRQIEGKPASTPVLDKLARQGMRFTNVWAHPFCSPTRATILTGLYAAKTKVATYADALSTKHTSFVRMLKDEAGYSTAVFGKWHMAGLPGKPADYPGMKPKQAGFDLFKGNMHAAIRSYWDYDYQVQDADTPADQWRTEPMPKKSLPGIAATNYAPVVKVADTIEWITTREKENPDKPWFVWLAFNLAHTTIIQKPSAMCVPNADTLDAVSYKEMKGCGGTFGSNDAGSCSGEALNRAMTNSLDTTLGKLLNAVDAMDSNTYVIFIGDNGTPMYGRPNLNFIDNMYITRQGRGKGTAYESGALVPMIIRGPKIAANTQSSGSIHVADLFATILQLARLDPPKQVADSDGTGTVPLDAVSMSPILFDKARSVRDPNTGYILNENKNLMTGGTRWVGAQNATHKVVCIDSPSNCTFYNLVDDPLEEKPLAKPDSCIGYTDGTWTPADPRWHYCRLTEVVSKYSILSEDKK